MSLSTSQAGVFPEGGTGTESRNGAFVGGAIHGRTGGTFGTRIATAQLPQAHQASGFQFGSVLEAANQYSGVLGGSSKPTESVKNPYALMIAGQLAESGTGEVPSQ